MKLRTALCSTGAIRDFTDEEVDDATVARILDQARFAPNGGNAQSWAVALVKDPGIRSQVRDLYARGFHEYLAMGAAGLRPWAPITDEVAETEAIEQGNGARAAGAPAG